MSVGSSSFDRVKGAIRGFLSRIILIILSIFVMGIAGEVVTRVFFTRDELRRVSSIFNPTNIWTASHDTTQHWIPRFPRDVAPGALVQVNARSYLVERTLGTRRALFLGDSGTLGTGVVFEKSYPYRFQAHLLDQHPGAALEVINAGVYGMTTLDEYSLLKEKLFALRPDLTVVGLFMANDIGFNLASERRLTFPSSNYASSLRWMQEHSAFSQFVFSRFLVLNDRYRWYSDVPLGKPTLLPEIGLIDENGLNHISYPENEIATYQPHYSRMTSEAFDLLQEALLRISIFSRGMNSRLVVLLIPTSSAIGERYLPWMFPKALAQLRARGVHVDPDKFSFDKPYEKVLRICAKLNILCVDPREPMRKLGPEKTIIHGDDHPSYIGHDVLGRTLAEAVGRDDQFHATRSVKREMLFDFDSAGIIGWGHRPLTGPPHKEIDLKDYTIVDPSGGRIFRTCRQDGDGLTGIFHTPRFRIKAPFLRMIVGGGSEHVKVHLIIDGQSVRSVSSAGFTELHSIAIDLAPYVGKEGVFDIVDESSAPEDCLTIKSVEFIDPSL